MEEIDTLLYELDTHAFPINSQLLLQGRIQDLIGGGGGADRDRPKLPMVCSSV